MPVVGLEIVDAGLVAAREGVRVAASPGVAIVAPAGIKVGEAAAAELRLQPVLAADRFWSDLAVDSLAGAAGHAVSHAELAHAHLEAVWRAVAAAGDEAVLAVPGSMRLHQAGLLLGIARHVGMPVAGVVDAAVAATAGLVARADVLHLDVQLHQAVLTVLEGEAVLHRKRVEIAPRAGLKPMFGAWAQLVSEAMVRRTRFDPLHQAGTEQQLYERLPGWLAALSGRESLEVAIDSGGGSHAATVRREQFLLAAEAWYAQLAELVRAGHRGGGPATLALSARAGLLPALAERLGAAPDIEVTILPEGAAAEAAAARAAEIGPADPPTLVTALARMHAAPHATRRSAGAPATHVVLEGRAHAIDERPLVIGFGEGPGRRIALDGTGEGISRSHCTLVREGGRALVRDHSRYGTFLNGGRISGEAELGAGDRLRVGSPGFVLELVAAD
jgi:hypothetical protein